MSLPKPVRRGRPPNEAARRDVLVAARDLLAEGGIAAVTIEALAARAGITRPTIYRHWPNAQAVAMAALIESSDRHPPQSRRRTLAKDLEAEVLGIVSAFSSPTGRGALAIVASADPSTELSKAFRHQLLLKTRDRVCKRLRRAVAEGELLVGADVECAADLVLAPVFFRLLVGHAPVTAEFARSSVKQLISGLARPRAPRKR